MEDFINKIYARTNEQSVVTHIFSEAFEEPKEQDICIDETNTDRHGANAYRVYDELGIANYEIRNGTLTERDKTAERRAIEVASYSQTVERKIRRYYSVSDELAILRQRESKPEEYAEYNAVCERCKAEAKAELRI